MVIPKRPNEWEYQGSYKQKTMLQPISRAQNDKLPLQHEVAQLLHYRGTHHMPVTNKHQTSYLVDHQPGGDLQLWCDAATRLW